MVKQWIRKVLGSAGYVLFNTRSRDYYARDSLFTTNNDGFREDPAFQAAYARGVKASFGHDPGTEWRIHVALWAARAASRVEGDFVECGVNAGFVSSAIMQNLDWRKVNKHFFLIDTFTGPVLSQHSQEEIDSGRLRVIEDAIARGGYVTDFERVRANYAEWPNVSITRGVVPDVLPAMSIDRVAFLHIDMNCAYPEGAALEHFWDLLSPGAMVLFDDYAYFGHESQGKAIAAAASLGADVLALPTGQGLIVK